MSYNPHITSSTVAMYNSTGYLGEQNLKVWNGTVACDGTATVDVSSAGFTQIIWVGAIADGANFAYTNISKNTSTSISIGVKSSAAAGLLVATGLIDGNCNVMVTVIGV